MPTLDVPEVAVVDSPGGSAEALPDFTSDTYKDAYSRINAIVIEGEQEAHDNYIAIGTLLPDDEVELKRLAMMEMKHAKGFTSCGKNLGVDADMAFAKKFFSPLHGNFQAALAKGKLTTCFLIQAILIEAFAI
ncbi:MAG: long-chain fatty aldehyde decarbonylase, partial [Prochlorococcaceae cyanobacterium ETNP14_MAG_4]|nr:long-chain fatty aldehyde decarbonylase [Prochlorococcaceae cyanobacterium ETNP14_MAG_4]